MKTRRYETPVAPARQSPPKALEAPVEAPAKVQQVEAGERGAGQRLDNFLARFLKDVPKTHIFRVIRKGEVRVRPDAFIVSLNSSSPYFSSPASG